MHCPDFLIRPAAILNSFVSNSYYVMPRGQIHANLPPEHSNISFKTILNENGRCIGKELDKSGIVFD